MERLTKYISGYAHGAEGRSKENLTGHYCRGKFEATACVERLAEYENAEEKGLLMRLPVAAGSTVYEINTLFHACMEKCAGCEYFHAGDSIFRDDPCCTYSDHYEEENRECLTITERKVTLEQIIQYVCDGSFGKTVFATKERAEEVLGKRRKNHEPD